MTTGVRAAAMPSVVSRLIAAVSVLFLILASSGPAHADPNPVLGNGVDCMAIKAGAQADASDPFGPDGDNWGATGACAVSVTQVGWGYDYKHVYLWLVPNNTGGQDLYVCTELFGLPGDADADGGYASNDGPCDAAFGPSCGGSEGSGGSIVGPSEEITLEIDPNCSDTFEPRVRLQLRNDLFFVASNTAGSGPAFPTILGGQGDVWQADPLVASGPDSVATCVDASIRRGGVIFCIENFSDFFAANVSWSPYAFNWKVIGGHSADQLSEDSVTGTFRLLNPDLRIQKSVEDDRLCGADATSFTILVTNAGNVPLSDVTVSDLLPAGLSYTGPSGLCEFGAPDLMGNQLSWDLGILGAGESRSCTFGVATDACFGELRNIAAVSAQVANVCLDEISLTASDTAYVLCTQPCVTVAAADTQACGVEGIEVPVTVTNCYGAESDIRLECRLNGQPLAPITFSGVGAGQSKTHLVPVACASEPSVLFCRAVSSPSAGPEDCTAADSVTVRVTCGEAGVQVNLVGAEICVGLTTPLPVEVRNTSSSAEDIALKCWIDGVLVDDRLLEDVPGGEATVVVLSVRCEEPDTVTVVCEAEARVVGQPECVARWRDTSIVVCLEPGVDINKDTNPRVLRGGVTSKVTLVVKNTGDSVLDPVRIWDVLPPGVVLAADPQFMATCETGLGGNTLFADTRIAFDDFVLGPGEECVIMYRIACEGGFEGDTLIDRAVVEAWCDGTYDQEPSIPPVTDADTAWVLCREDSMECPEPQPICFWQDQCGEDRHEEDGGEEHHLLASLDGSSDGDDGSGEAVVCPALMEHIARCVVERSALVEWAREDEGSVSGSELRSILDDGVLVGMLCEQLENDLDAGLRELGEGQYLTLLMNVCAWALSPSNPVDARGYVGTAQGVLDGLAGALNGGGDVKYWTEVACSVNNGIGVYVPEECKPICDRGCTYTQGYWKNHPEAWPTASLTLGTVNYTADELLDILERPVAGNGLISLAHQLIAAKLNLQDGTTAPVGVHMAITQADLLIGGRVVPPIGNGYLAPGAVSALTETLDDYNSGSTGPGHCDQGDDDHSGDDHSGDDHNGDDHNGDDHNGDDHNGDVDDHHGDDDHGDARDSRTGWGRGKRGNSAALSADSKDNGYEGEEDCCTLILKEEDGEDEDHHVEQHMYKRGGTRNARYGEDHGEGDDHGEVGSYGCCGSETELDREDSAVATASWWWDWRRRGDDDHGDDDHDTGDHDDGEDHNDEGEDQDDHGCQEVVLTRPAFVDKMGLCPPEEDDHEDGATILSTQARNEPTALGGEIRTLALVGYPNPVLQSPMTLLMRVPTHLAGVGTADVGVFDVTGRQVRRLEVGVSGSGEYRVEWDLTDDTGRGVSSGIYFTKLRVGPEQLTQRILVVRQ